MASLNPLFARSSSFYSSDGVYSSDGEHFGLESLVQDLDESLKISELTSLERLLEENRTLCLELQYHREELRAIREMISKMNVVFSHLKKSLAHIEERGSRAKKEWLATWGIHTDPEIVPWI